MVSGECRLRVFLAEYARPDKRRKTDTGGADMDVLAGARRGGEDKSLAEDIIGEVRGLMRAEVEAEVMRQSLRRQTACRSDAHKHVGFCLIIGAPGPKEGGGCRCHRPSRVGEPRAGTSLHVVSIPVVHSEGPSGDTFEEASLAQDGFHDHQAAVLLGM